MKWQGLISNNGPVNAGDSVPPSPCGFVFFVGLWSSLPIVLGVSLWEESVSSSSIFRQFCICREGKFFAVELYIPSVIPQDIIVRYIQWARNQAQRSRQGLKREELDRCCLARQTSGDWDPGVVLVEDRGSLGAGDFRSCGSSSVCGPCSPACSSSL